MMDAPVNLYAVIVAGVASLVLGFVWFTIIFRELYLEGLGKTAEQLDRGPSTAVASVYQLIGNIVMAYALGWLMVQTGSQNLAGGLGLGLLVWIGFVAAVIGPMYAFQAFSLKFFAITGGYPLVSLLLMGAILGSWR